MPFVLSLVISITISACSLWLVPYKPMAIAKAQDRLPMAGKIQDRLPEEKLMPKLVKIEYFVPKEHAKPAQREKRKKWKRKRSKKR